MYTIEKKFLKESEKFSENVKSQQKSNELLLD